MDKCLTMMGLALRAGRLEAGEEPAGAACAAKRCRLLLTARDASDNTQRRARRFAEEGQCLILALPFTKEELGGALGRGSCAVAAVTDVGLACALAGKLAEQDPERYGEAQQRLRLKAERASQRAALRCKPGKRPGGRRKRNHEKKA